MLVFLVCAVTCGADFSTADSCGSVGCISFGPDREPLNARVVYTTASLISLIG